MATAVNLLAGVSNAISIPSSGSAYSKNPTSYWQLFSYPGNTLIGQQALGIANNGWIVNFVNIVSGVIHLTITPPSGATPGNEYYLWAWDSASVPYLLYPATSYLGVPANNSYLIVSSVPLAPTSVSIGSVTTTSFRGTTPSSFPMGATSFSVQYSTDNVTWTTGASSLSTSASWNITGLSANTDYYLRYLAVNTYGSTPSVSSILCGTGGRGFTITGKGFTGTTSVNIGTSSCSFTVVSDTSLSVTSPSSYSNGALSVTTPAGTVVSGFTFPT